MSTEITVAFRGATLLLVEHQQQPYVPMKPVVVGMGLAWEPQAAKLRSNSRWGMTEIVIPTAGGEQGTSCLPLRKLPGWMNSIHPAKVRPEIRDTVIAFQNECDDILWDAWQKRMGAPIVEQPTPINPEPPSIQSHFQGGRWLVHMDQRGNLIFNPVDPEAFHVPAREFPAVISSAEFPSRLLPMVLAAAAEPILIKRAFPSIAFAGVGDKTNATPQPSHDPPRRCHDGLLVGIDPPFICAEGHQRVEHNERRRAVLVSINNPIRQAGKNNHVVIDTGQPQIRAGDIPNKEPIEDTPPFFVVKLQGLHEFPQPSREGLPPVLSGDE